MSLEEVQKIREILLSSREKAVGTGDYISAIADHEQVVVTLWQAASLAADANAGKALIS